jgi:hypothetical protein
MVAAQCRFSRNMPDIANLDLTLTSIPRPDADWETIGAFALMFDGYHAWGSFEKCAEIANAQRDGTLTELRTCLFFEQRRWRHFGDLPDEAAMAYICSMIEKIRVKVAAGELG